MASSKSDVPFFLSGYTRITFYSFFFLKITYYSMKVHFKNPSNAEKEIYKYTKFIISFQVKFIKLMREKCILKNENRRQREDAKWMFPSSFTHKIIPYKKNF